MLPAGCRRIISVVALAVFLTFSPARHPLSAPATLHAHPPLPATQSTAARDATRIDPTRLLRDVQALSAPEIEGRLAGTPGSLRAQAIILERFKELSLEPLNGSHEQKFSFTTTGRHAPRPNGQATNLIGMIPGRGEGDRFVLVTAHYDHLGVRDGQIYHGADDNASGVAAMLAIAGWFAANPPRKSLVFVAFDAEEQGLQGSKQFVAHPPIDLARVSAVVNLDMVGRGDKNVLHVAGTFYNPSLKGLVEESAAGRGIVVRFGHDRPGVRGLDDWTYLSDHGSFHSAGIPFLYFGVDDHRDYHKPTDTADKIPMAFFREATELALETIRRLVEVPPIARARRQ